MNNLLKNKWLLVGILAIAETLSQFSLNHANKIKKNNMFYIVLGMTIYSLLGYIFYLLLQSSNSVIWANLFWNIGSFIGAIIISVLINKEKLSIYKVLSVIFLFLAIIFYEIA